MDFLKQALLESTWKVSMSINHELHFEVADRKSSIPPALKGTIRVGITQPLYPLTPRNTDMLRTEIIERTFSIPLVAYNSRTLFRVAIPRIRCIVIYGVQAVTLLLSFLRIMFFSGNHMFNLIELFIEPLPLFM